MNKNFSVLNMVKLSDFKNKNKEQNIPDHVWKAQQLPIPERGYHYDHPYKYINPKTKRLNNNWHMDYAWPDIKVGVEIDGGIWLKGDKRGSHSRGSGILRNYKKRNAMAEMGWVLLCYLPNNINYEQIKKTIFNRSKFLKINEINISIDEIKKIMSSSGKIIIKERIKK